MTLAEQMNAAVTQLLREEAQAIEAALAQAIVANFVCAKCGAGPLKHRAIIQDNSNICEVSTFLRLACPGDDT